MTDVVLDLSPESLPSAIVYYCKNSVRVDSDQYYVWSHSLWKYASYEELVSTIFNRIMEVKVDDKKIKDRLRQLDWNDIVQSVLDKLTCRGFTSRRDSQYGFIPVLHDQLVNLSTGISRPRNMDDTFTYYIPYPYSPDADLTKAHNFMMSLVNSDMVMYNLLQRILGYCLIGRNTEKKVFILYNESYDNGKGLLENILGKMYNKGLVKAYPGFFEDIKALEGPKLKYWDELGSKRVVLFSYVDDILELPLSHVSTLTNSSFNSLIMCNNLPKVKDYSVRHLICPIRINTITDDVKTCQSYLEPKFLTSLLAWLVEGAKLYYREERLIIPECVSQIDMRKVHT